MRLSDAVQHSGVLVKKRAFVGQSTPIGFDYKNGYGSDAPEEVGWPNPVLENVNGMLLCYDEIWFIARDHCPMDLHDLPYICFIEDDPKIMDMARVAREQFTVEYDDDAVVLPEPNFQTWARVANSLQSSVRFEMSMDNHGRPVHQEFYGNAVGNSYLFAQDIGIAAAIDETMDIVTNSVMGEALCQLDTGRGTVDFTQMHLDAVEQVIALRTVDRLGPRGAYHESIEELRAHARLREFREFLSASDVSSKDAVNLTREVNRLADEYARDCLDRFLKGNGRIQTLSSASIGFGGNYVMPGLGSVLSGAMTATTWIRERAQRKKMAWSLFVLDARDSN